MESSLGTQIREARERRHWEQAELVLRLQAVAVRTSQQAVSRWERDQTRPAKAARTALVELLDIRPLDSIKTTLQPSPEQSVPTTRPLLTSLRFEDLTPDGFEEFSADLATYLFPDADVHRAGTSGHKQDGIDVVVDHKTGPPTGIQCKREKRFGPQKVRNAVDALTMDVRKGILFLSRPASPEARREIKKNTNWDIWDSNDLSRKVRLLSRDQALRLIDSYFPGMRAPFLGIPSPGPWQDRGEYFAPISGDSIYSHRWPLFGRTSIVENLEQSLAESAHRLTVLVGRGGLGKTRILRSLAETVELADSISTVFLIQGSPVSAQDFEHLPTAPLIVVIDDAHERADLISVIGGIFRNRPGAQVLLSMRPYGWSSLATSVRALGIHPTKIDRIDLGDLAYEAAAELAKDVLPSEAAGLAPYLAKIGTDCPLLIVVGGGLVREGRIDAQRLIADPELGIEILKAFGNAVSSSPNGETYPARREILKAVSIMQPFRMGADGFREAISRLTGLAYDQISAELTALEDRGVLLRRGNALRVVPDLLGDTLLAQAMFDKNSSISTGYAERVHEIVSGEVFDNALTNATRVDWCANREHGHSSQAIDPLWKSLEQDFRKGGVGRRADILRRLREIANFQPARCIELARWAFENPTTEGDDSQFWGLPPSYESVHREIAPMLQIAAYDLGFLTDAADLLWSLGRLDPRPLNQNPEQPIRILASICEFQSFKPTAISSQLISCAERWLGQPGLERTTYSPFDAIKSVLATEGESYQSDGLRVTIVPFAINAEVVQPLRSEALHLAFGQLTNSDTRQSVRAVSFIEEGLRYPRGGFGRTAGTDESSRWTPLILKLLADLRDLVSRTVLDPVTLVAIRFACDWHLKYSSTGTKQAAQELIQSIPDSVEYRLALSLHDGWNHLGRNLDNYEASQEDQIRGFQQIVKSLARFPTDRVVALLSERLEADRRGFTERTGHPFPFFKVLFEGNSNLAAQVCEAALLHSAGVLHEALADAISELIRSDISVATQLARDLRAKNDEKIDRQLAHALTSGRDQRVAEFDGEEAILGQLARSSDLSTRLVLARGMRWLAQANRKLAGAILAQIDFSDSSNIAEEVMVAFTRQHGFLLWNDLDELAQSTFISRLAATPSIDDYQLMMFLSDRSMDNPVEVFELLTERIISSESRDRHYKPLPFHWHQPLAFRQSDQFGLILRKVRDWIAEGAQSWQRRRYGAELFSAIAGNFDGEVQDVLEEGVASGTADAVRAVAAILTEAPRDLVWNEREFVTRILRTADSMDREFARQIGGGLESAVIFGLRSGTPGQPYREDLEQRDRSLKIALELPPGSIERKFYEALHESGDRSVQREVADEQLSDDGRRW